ncbi:coiled-coil domain-containing protein 34 [Synchiropus splendidus]|uniref:coiled-coil domain-containing protein 34 n=1 Tax=Synchiropus splendidus TaxID=270530 RepID=UPI00237D6E86|nr:coiled-coil domain-containing protein 34 [Synchiropus splendidus]
MFRKGMPRRPASASEGFSSTPVKSSQSKHVLMHMDDGVLSEDDDTFTQLSPIYNDSFDSDDELENGDSRRSASPLRCELPKARSSLLEHEGSPSLGAWELWLVNKAKKERLKLERKEDEERLMRQKLEQGEVERRRKKEIVEEKIREWLKVKREQEKKEQLCKLIKEEEEMQRRQEKLREAEQKAQQKFNDWLHKKKQEKLEKLKKEKEEANLKAEQEKERRRKAEEKFQEWLAKADDRSRASPKSPQCPASPYDKFHPSPGFYNPIPWKPNHVPPPESPVNRMPIKKPQNQSSNAARTVKNSGWARQNR